MQGSLYQNQINTDNNEPEVEVVEDEEIDRPSIEVTGSAEDQEEELDPESMATFEET